jgi:hypothetical protein
MRKTSLSLEFGSKESPEEVEEAVVPPMEDRGGGPQSQGSSGARRGDRGDPV